MNLTLIDNEVQKVNVMSMRPSLIDLSSTQILCLFRMKVVENLPLKLTEKCTYYCERACTSDMYTFQSGNMTLNFSAKYGNRKSLTSGLFDPHCSKCSVGAKCSGNIKAFPNYWGYRNKDEVSC